MYIEQDFAGPATLDLQANRKMRNRILRYWPKKTVDGVEILDYLYMYRNGSVQKSENHLKIYSILGIKVADLDAQKWTGIENYYAYFKVMQGDQDNLAASDLVDYIDALSPITEKSLPTLTENDVSVWYSANIGYAPLKVTLADSALSDAEIVNRIKLDPYLATYSLSEEKLTALVLLDVNEDIFERKFTVVSRILEPVSSLAHTSKDNLTSVVKEISLVMTYRRKKGAGSVLTTFAESMLGKIANAAYSIGKVLDTQLTIIYRDNVPFVDSDILLMQQVSDNTLFSGVFASSGYKVEGLRAMKGREFNTTITSRIDTGFTKKKVSRWKKLVTIVVTIIIVVLAIIAAIPTGGNSLGLAATILTVGSLAMMGLSIVLAKSDPAWAAYIGKASTVLGYLAAIAGIINIVNQMAKGIAAEAGKEGIKDAGKEVVADSIKEIGKEAGKEAVKEMTFQEAVTVIKDLSFEQLSDALVAFAKASFSSTTSMSMTNVLNWATKGFQIYTKYIAPPDKGVDDLKDKVAAQEEVLEDLTGPGLKDKIDYTFSSPYYNIYDFNEFMQGIPHSMTQGKIDEAFNKYYDGTTSKVKYRGYLG